LDQNYAFDKLHENQAMTGKCNRCASTFDLSDMPIEVDYNNLPCQMAITNLGGTDVPVALVCDTIEIEIYQVRSSQGITSLRPCNGILQIEKAGSLD
jgi:hypothetical protein